LDAVQWAAEAGPARNRLRGLLKAAPDMARALSRLSLDRGGPRDLAALRDGLGAAAQVAALLDDVTELPPALQEVAAALRGVDPGLADTLAAALADDLPLQKRDGGFVRAGHHAGLDEALRLRDDTRGVIAALQGRYAEATGTKNLKVKHNTMLGFFIEVAQQVGETWLRPPASATFIHRQTMAGAMRFVTVELTELDGRIGSAAAEALAHELAVFGGLAALVLAAAPTIRAAADALAALDVALGLGELATARNWVRPRVDGSLAFAIEGGRHPVVEAALKGRGKPFVANDCDLTGTAPRGAAKGGGRLAVVTGPNMAGKSTFLRQNALIALLAQIGSFVPATAAHIGVVDRLFSRVGAADDLARGRSTFMVEMVETAAILNQAGPRALVILDEIGRGTATFDGLSIAWAAAEHLHEVNRSRGLFATHYHELTQLGRTLKRLTNLTMRVTEWQGDVVFLHEVLPGAADRSYGIQVAKLAGLPRAAVERARSILSGLEASSRAAPVERLVGDLPLFAAIPEPAVAPALHEDGGGDALRAALAALDPDDLTPRAALEALFALKRLATGGSDR
ncbi:DNA mismatch repair protein MutS, partial [Lichenihabitans sp. Uapishka_5]|uniref:DNA mismatch repair protein MutS n=1 Tax=Lichenihabitans sp. Uapishka_5 TaxID=3037302 RepID=UPI0029E7D540